MTNSDAVELSTSASRHWCITIQPCFPIDAVSGFSVKDWQNRIKSRLLKNSTISLSSTIYTFKEGLHNFTAVDNEFLAILETLQNV